MLVITSAAAVNKELLFPSLFGSFEFSGGTAEKLPPDGLKGDYIDLKNSNLFLKEFNVAQKKFQNRNF